MVQAFCQQGALAPLGNKPWKQARGNKHGEGVIVPPPRMSLLVSWFWVGLLRSIPHGAFLWMGFWLGAGVSFWFFFLVACYGPAGRNAGQGWHFAFWVLGNL